ncbi:hypothetical protein TcBrA4_0049360 [Trypanosoma cruzi]|nr:hypothetical protein TcBrA4_0049360 [Trypanosoma cruzi]
MLLNGFLVPGCWRCIRLCGCVVSVLRRPPAMLIGVPFSYSIAAAPNLTPSSTKPPVHPSRRFLLGVAKGLCVRCGGRSSGHKSGADLVGAIRSGTTREARKRTRAAVRGGVTVRGGQRASVRSAGRSAMMKPCGFLAGCCGWRTMEALKRKAFRMDIRARLGNRERAAALPPTRILHSTASRGSRNYFARLLLCGIRRAAGRRKASKHHALTPCVASARSSALCTPASVCLSSSHAKDKIVDGCVDAASIPHGDSPRVPIPQGCWKLTPRRVGMCSIATGVLISEAQWAVLSLQGECN